MIHVTVGAIEVLPESCEALERKRLDEHARWRAMAERLGIVSYVSGPDEHYWQTTMIDSRDGKDVTPYQQQHPPVILWSTVHTLDRWIADLGEAGTIE